jgi:hypothetical protein
MITRLESMVVLNASLVAWTASLVTEIAVFTLSFNFIFKLSVFSILGLLLSNCVELAVLIATGLVLSNCVELAVLIATGLVVGLSERVCE